MSDGLLIALVVVVISQFGLLWYKLGRIEQGLSNHVRSNKKKEEVK